MTETQGASPEAMHTFGNALEALKQGKRIARKGWNGKGMYLILITGGSHGEDSILLSHFDPALVASQYQGGDIPVDPVIAMKTAGDTLQLGWLANQADMLADDWEVLK
jgi:hypothetical protein